MSRFDIVRYVQLVCPTFIIVAIVVEILFSKVFLKFPMFVVVCSSDVRCCLFLKFPKVRFVLRESAI